MLADGHLKGKYGLASSEALSFSYYKEIAKGWIAGISDSDAYQYLYNKYYLDLFLADLDKFYLKKSERQQMMLDLVRKVSDD